MGDTTHETTIECPDCGEKLSLKDLASYQGVCYVCWCDVEEALKITGAHEVAEEDWDTSDAFDGAELTLCCDSDEQDCECEFPERAPTFDVALERYLGLLPENIYDISDEVPCISDCDNCWMAGCEPLRNALHLIHMHQAEIKAGIETPEEPYIGAIDGCINFTQRIEDHRVRTIRVERDSS